MGIEILCYAPNVIGYVRLLLVFVSWISFYSHPEVSISMYSVSIILDAVDGYVARRLNQTSAFGAWFDVVIDIWSRGMLWCRMYDVGYVIPALEWTTFVCTHSLGSDWKNSFVEVPWLVKQVMANNFKTPLGVFTMAGLQVLPIWLYAYQFQILQDLLFPISLQYFGITILSIARVLCSSVEIWCLQAHIKYLISDEANQTQTSSSSRN